MELKDVILSTLAEMEDVKSTMLEANSIKETISKLERVTKIPDEPIEKEEQVSNNEMLFLTSIRERMLVLFEGFQAPNNTNIEAKVDMTLNFLEYILVTIDSRIDELERKEANR